MRAEGAEGHRQETGKRADQQKGLVHARDSTTMVRAGASLRSVGAGDLHVAVVAGPGHADAPGIAAHLAILHEGAGHVGLEIYLDLLAAVRTRDEQLIVHSIPM